MNFVYHEHRYGKHLLENRFPDADKEISDVIKSITDQEIIEKHQLKFAASKSISKALNALFKEKFVKLGWKPESPIFSQTEYQRKESGRKDGTWRLDLAKGDDDAKVSVEVAFNHGEALAWNLLKPVLASEINHVDKAIQTELGVVILATADMKLYGGFDSAVGTFDKAIQYLIPLQSQLTVPLVLIGLEAPTSFWVEHIGVGRAKRAEFHMRTT